MQILSHRGYWLDQDEKNQIVAFRRSFEMGYGTETDLRDSGSKIVVSHDKPKGNEVLFEDFLDLMNEKNLTLALNIKADGLIDDILNILKKYNHTNYFTFDMSIPDMVFQTKRNVKIFAPYSDIVSTPILLEESIGVWLDCFYSLWYTNSVIEDLIDSGKKVCIVSSDLHKRDNTEQWQILKNSKYINSNDLLICTDKLDEAIKFFQ